MTNSLYILYQINYPPWCLYCWYPSRLTQALYSGSRRNIVIFTTMATQSQISEGIYLWRRKSNKDQLWLKSSAWTVSVGLRKSGVQQYCWSNNMNTTEVVTSLEKSPCSTIDNNSKRKKLSGDERLHKKWAIALSLILHFCNPRPAFT